MRRFARPTLAQVFLGAMVAMSLAVGVSFFVFLGSTRSDIVSRSRELRNAAAREIAGRVGSELGVATQAIDEIERAIRSGAIDLDDPDDVEALLFMELQNHPTLSDLTLTHARAAGYAADGSIELASGPRWQLSLHRRTADPGSAINTRRVSSESGRVAGARRSRPPGGALLSAPLAPTEASTDPTTRAAFLRTASRSAPRAGTWTDLHFSQFDADLPTAQRRVTVALERSVFDGAGAFAGVVRAGLLTQTIDALPRLAVEADGARDARRAFLCDARGRLVTRPDPSDALESVGDDVRVAEVDVPASIRQALASPALAKVKNTRRQASTTLDVGGERFLLTFRALEGTPGWLVGVIAPENYYTQDLVALRSRFLVAYLVITVVALFGGALALRALQRGLGSIGAATALMRRFDFTASNERAAFRDVSDVIDELERAKTSMRALSKYVPIDLVRELHESNREPVLGGDLVSVSIMFTDIQGFTSFAEALAPDALARALGR